MYLLSHIDHVDHFLSFFVSAVGRGHTKRNEDTLDSDIYACFCAETAAGAASASLMCHRL